MNEKEQQGSSLKHQRKNQGTECCEQLLGGGYRNGQEQTEMQDIHSVDSTDQWLVSRRLRTEDETWIWSEVEDFSFGRTDLRVSIGLECKATQQTTGCKWSSDKRSGM